jgi:hypothetical protein
MFVLTINHLRPQSGIGRLGAFDYRPGGVHRNQKENLPEFHLQKQADTPIELNE